MKFRSANKHIDSFESKPYNPYSSETDFIAGRDRYDHSAYCVKYHAIQISRNLLRKTA